MASASSPTKRPHASTTNPCRRPHASALRAARSRRQKAESSRQSKQFYLHCLLPSAFCFQFFIYFKKTLDPGTRSTLYTPLVSDDGAKHDALLSGELARQAGVSTDTLRHYERKGVLPRPQRTPN